MVRILSGIYAEEVSSLSPEEEIELFLRLKADQRDKEAIQKIIESHMKLVYRIVRRANVDPKSELYKDCVSAGLEGLMKAMWKFDLSRGYHFSAYAYEYIRSEVSECKLCAISMVKMTTDNIKRAFRQLPKAISRVSEDTSRGVTCGNVSAVATYLEVKERDVQAALFLRSGGDFSLNSPIYFNGDSGVDLLASHGENPEEALLSSSEYEYDKDLIKCALRKLRKRDRRIFRERYLTEKRKTLCELGAEFEISKTRVDQVQKRAFGIVKKFIKRKHARSACT